ncbi:MAG: hypothetical protein ACJA1P_000049 [Maribacter sp.]|jgi:hypothetical protein
MKTRLYIIAISFLILFSSCSKDDEKRISLVELNFVAADGSIIFENSCIDPNATYALKVQVLTEGSGQMNPTKIEYTLNGVIHGVTFSAAGIKNIPVEIINGPNVAQLLSTGITKRINYKAQGEFELVP